MPVNKTIKSPDRCADLIPTKRRWYEKYKKLKQVRIAMTHSYIGISLNLLKVGVTVLSGTGEIFSIPYLLVCVVA